MHTFVCDGKQLMGVGAWNINRVYIQELFESNEVNEFASLIFSLTSSNQRCCRQLGLFKAETIMY